MCKPFNRTCLFLLQISVADYYWMYFPLNFTQQKRNTSIQTKTHD